MDISGPLPGNSTLMLTNASPSAQLQLGQRLDASVTALLDGGKILIDIGGTRLEARTSLTTSVGQRLELEVIEAGKQTILSIVSPPPSSTPLTAALRKTLPQQQAMQTIFTRLTALLSSSSELPPATAALLEQLIEQLPTPEDISRADVLKQAMMDSGPFLEHKLSLAPKAAALAGDLKANLLRLLAESSQSDDTAAKNLTQLVETGLARIQLHQLSTFADMQTPSAAWAGELPVRRDNHVDVFQFHIEKDGKSETNPARKSWNTWLSFNIASLGPMHVKISLTNTEIAATLWAELHATADLIEQNLPILRQSLDRLGLTIKGLQCLQGRPPRPAADRLPRGLLDIIA